ncbi:hypothetical protein BDW02DRAFT_92643 [Decorospora gaudefroyi]|uniref:Uncharacterized protein n=1 Tax=Decorospora gaudefroyi TaxID=184978 RepID=A0A6A5JZK4_9PLEO|nr:hypothetical protein BDW02DRAFT_92643 [Decorospora gaudefroyi]
MRCGVGPQSAPKTHSPTVCFPSITTVRSFVDSPLPTPCPRPGTYGHKMEQSALLVSPVVDTVHDHCQGPPSASSTDSEELQLILPGDAGAVSACLGAGELRETISLEELEQRAQRGCPVCMFYHDALHKVAYKGMRRSQKPEVIGRLCHTKYCITNLDGVPCWDESGDPFPFSFFVTEPEYSERAVYFGGLLMTAPPIGRIAPRYTSSVESFRRA